MILDNPRVTVVTVSFNQAEFVRETIESVLSQSYPNLEYIVIDGGSTDGSVDIIQEYRDHLSHFVTEPDEGQSDALNKGFEKSTGEILCWINSDDYFMPGGIQKMVKLFPAESGPQWLIAGCEMVGRGGDVLGTRNGLHVTLDRSFIWGSRNWFPQQSTFWNREMWKQVGPVDVDLHYTMDYALWLRMFEQAEPKLESELVSCYRFHEQAKGSAGRLQTIQELMKVRLEYYSDRFASRVLAESLDEALAMDARNLVRAGIECGVDGRT